ncbi:hypothetical protein [Geotoga petraea]|jgi:hypothetical protein|uniref:Uncharacterized protein n=1 Tax=Geotoga petraea TaxID=28234 RepID=A0A1G6NUZ4_9BACT|nr:hypothetical protein [Geotoga petraea]SDC71578.1 hypothetical protein SAMN04488588_1669 [Geotoga petraea]
MDNYNKMVIVIGIKIFGFLIADFGKIKDNLGGYYKQLYIWTFLVMFQKLK